MDKTPRMKQALVISLLTLLMCGSSLTLWAQEEHQEPTKPVPQDQRETQEADNTPTTNSEETDAQSAPATAPEETGAGDSPFDYKSSEKISEDLSVSFPVDI